MILVTVNNLDYRNSVKIIGSIIIYCKSIIIGPRAIGHVNRCKFYPKTNGIYYYYYTHIFIIQMRKSSLLFVWFIFQKNTLFLHTSLSRKMIIINYWAKYNWFFLKKNSATYTTVYLNHGLLLTWQENNKWVV